MTVCSHDKMDTFNKLPSEQITSKLEALRHILKQKKIKV